jgi:hypothetical protein
MTPEMNCADAPGSGSIFVWQRTVPGISGEVNSGPQRTQQLMEANLNE